MIVAISRFRVRNGLEAEVRAAFVNRPRLVDDAPDFLGMEVFTDAADPAMFTLLTRWANEEAFRAWHHSPAHHDSHRFMPPGLKLDPAATVFILAERINGASSGGVEAELLADGAPSFARALREGSSLFAAVITSGGTIARASRALEARLGRPVAGVPLGDVMVEGSATITRTALATGAPLAHNRLGWLNSRGEPFTLACNLYPFGRDRLLIGEAPVDDQQALADTLEGLNRELTVLSRENAVKASALAAAMARSEAAHKELDEAHWHLAKIAEVLPICVECHRVRTSAHNWEEAASFLARYGSFLSHGYCADCAQQITATLDRQRT